jgi:hypothetical protein
MATWSALTSAAQRPANAAVFANAPGLCPGRALGESVIGWAARAGYDCVVTDWRVTNPTFLPYLAEARLCRVLPAAAPSRRLLSGVPHRLSACTYLAWVVYCSDR